MATFAKKKHELPRALVTLDFCSIPWTDRQDTPDRQIIEIYSIRGSTQKQGILFYDFMTLFLTNCTELKKTMSKNKVKLFP